MADDTPIQIVITNTEGSAITGSAFGADPRDGVFGQGVMGTTDGGNGVYAASTSGVAMLAQADTGTAIQGASNGNKGMGLLAGTDLVYGQHAGVYGESDQQGVFGNSTADKGTGVYGIANRGAGFGVRGESQAGTAVQGRSYAGGYGVRGVSATGTGVHGTGGAHAGLFDGHVQVNGDQNVTGTLTVEVDIALSGGDCAEEFDLAGDGEGEPGMVMVLDDTGALRPSEFSYDRRVAGVVSGAGDYRPGLILDRAVSATNRAAIALLGKVHCKVDAQYGAITIGDPLTTSPTPGHAMKATDAQRAFGAVLGKAIGSLEAGCGTVAILATLR